MKIKYFIAPLVIIALVFFASSKDLASQEEPSSKSIGYAPVSQELHISPGETYSDKITVWHQSESDMKYSIVIRGFKQIEDHPGTAVLLSEEEEMKSETSAASWFRAETEEVVIPPQHNFEMNYLIEVPEEAAPGEYYAQIFFYTTQEEFTDTDSVMAYSNIAGGPTFLIRTGQEMDEEISLLEFKSTNKFYENPQITLNTSVHNTGNVHLKPNGVIVLKNMFGQELDSIEFNPGRRALIRDSFATYVTEWESNYLLTDEGKLAVGPITAELTLYYKSESPGYHPITAETEFWILQWKLGLAILGAIIVLIWTIKAVKKSKKTEPLKVETTKEEAKTNNEENVNEKGEKDEKRNTL